SRAAGLALLRQSRCNRPSLRSHSRCWRTSEGRTRDRHRGGGRKPFAETLVCWPNANRIDSLYFLGRAGVGCDRAARDHVPLPAQSSAIMLGRFEGVCRDVASRHSCLWRTKHAKRRENFSRRSTAYLFITFFVDFLSCTSCVSWTKGM